MSVAIRHHHRAPAPGHRGGEQDGTALLQAAFVIPIFVLFLLGLVDIGLGVFQTSQATSAAADGARAGIVDHEFWDVDVAGTPANDRVLAAVRARAVGQTIPSSDVGISCVASTGATIACKDADEGDRLKVTVTMLFRPISPMGKSLAGGSVTGTAKMAIVPQPRDDLGPTTTTTMPTTTTTSTTTTVPNSTTTTTAPPNTCVVQVVTATPSTISVNGAGKTTAAVQVTVTTNGSPACFGLQLTVEPGFTIDLATADSVTFLGTIPKGTDLGKNAGLRQGTFNLAPGPWPVVTVS